MKTVRIVIAAGLIGIAAYAQDGKPPRDAAAELVKARVYARECGFTNAAAALARYDELRAAFPDADAAIRAQIQNGRAFSIYRMGDYAAGLIELNALVRDYPDAPARMLANASMYAGYCQQMLGDQAAAQATYERILRDYPTADPGVLAQTAQKLSNLLVGQGKTSEANAVRMQLIRDYAWNFTIPDEKHIIWKAFDAINPNTVDAEIYRAFLMDTIKVVKAIEENTRFLGRVQSELEKKK